MLSTTVIKNTHIQPLIFSSIRLLHIFNGRHNPNVNLYQRSVIQQYVHLKVTDQSLRTNVSVSNNLGESAQQPTSIPSNKSNQNRAITSPIFNCRLIQPDEFTNEFEHLVFRTFILEEPISRHLGITEPDECMMLFIRQILQRAKEDRVSLGIYDDTNNNQCIDETKKTKSVKHDDIQQSSDSSSINRQKLPICYIINHIESVDDPPNKNHIEMDLSKALIENQNKYKCIGDILSKIVENVDLFTKYKARRIMQSFLAGIEPSYANQGLFTRLKMATIELAQANKCDLIYSKATSQFSTRANLKLGFHKAYSIDYSTYENDKGQRVFTGMSNIHQACTLTVKDLRD